MGCFMRTHIEVKKNGRWYHLSQPMVRQDYYLYTVIAGVRADNYPRVKPVANIHTIPDDISFVTQMCLEQDKSGYFIHDEGVLTAEDLQLLQDRLYEYNPSIQRTGCDELDLEESVFRTYINGNTLSEHQGWDDLRIVFWFDN